MLQRLIFCSVACFVLVSAQQASPQIGDSDANGEIAKVNHLGPGDPRTRSGLLGNLFRKTKAPAIEVIGSTQDGPLWLGCTFFSGTPHQIDMPVLQVQGSFSEVFEIPAPVESLEDWAERLRGEKQREVSYTVSLWRWKTSDERHKLRYILGERVAYGDGVWVGDFFNNADGSLSKNELENNYQERVHHERREEQERERQRVEEAKRREEMEQQRRLKEQRREEQERERQRVEEAKRREEMEQQRRLEEQRRKEQERERQRVEEAKRREAMEQQRRLEEQRREEQERERQRVEEAKHREETERQRRLEEERRLEQERERRRTEEAKRREAASHNLGLIPADEVERRAEERIAANAAKRKAQNLDIIARRYAGTYSNSEGEFIEIQAGGTFRAKVGAPEFISVSGRYDESSVLSRSLPGAFELELKADHGETVSVTLYGVFLDYGGRRFTKK